MAEFFRTGIDPIATKAILKKTAVLYAPLDSARNGGKEITLP